MSDNSERAYWWIDARTNGLSKWIGSNRDRLLLMGIFAWLGIWGLFLEGADDLDIVRQLIRGMGPELAGIVIAAVTINALAERRLEQERKAQLIRQLGSKYRDVTEMALIELRHKGWLEDGSLKGASLMKADLGRADLMKADLSQVCFDEANLIEAVLMHANLSEANFALARLNNALLGSANLNEAYLGNADLTDANLFEADLSRADLEYAYMIGAHLGRSRLCGARLWQVSLDGAHFEEADLNGITWWTIWQLEQAKTLAGAIMPDGVRLGREESFIEEHIEGPTFEVWKRQYLEEYGGTIEEGRDM